MSVADSKTSHHISALLLAWGEGDAKVLDQLASLIDGELRRLARSYLRQQSPDHILQTTALVNEAWLKLLDWQNASWQSRAHFLGIAAQLMRQILVDEARRHHALKRGSGMLHVSLSDAANVVWNRRPDLLALDEALNDLAAFDKRKCRIVELRFFGGLNIEETAEALCVSPRTVARDWDFAQAWLYRALSRGNNHA